MTQQSAPLMQLLLTGSPHWQISDSWPRLSLIPEQGGNYSVSGDDERQSRNLVRHSGSSAHLVGESALCWLLALLKHATEDTFLLAGDIKATSDNVISLNTFWSLHCSLADIWGLPWCRSFQEEPRNLLSVLSLPLYPTTRHALSSFNK